MTARIHHADLWGSRDDKYAWLSHHDVTDTDWSKLDPQQPFYLFVPQDTALLVEYQEGWNVSDMMPVNSVGLVTARDALTIHYSAEGVWRTVSDFASLPPETARENYSLGKDAQDWKVHLAQADLRESGPDRAKVVAVLYRPFDTRFTYYTGASRGFLCRPRPEVMRHMLWADNLGLQTCRQIISPTWQHILPTRQITDDSCVSNKTRERGYLFPVYLHPEPAKILETSPWPEGREGRRPNLSPEFIEDFAGKLGMDFVSDGKGDLEKTFGPEDVFHYAYAVFHSPTYRRRYAEFLKIDFPRLPLTSDRKLFARLCQLGAELVGLHLLEKVPKPAATYPQAGSNKVTRAGTQRSPMYVPATDEHAGRVYVNDEQYFENVPPEVWSFHVGGYQVCQKWLKDRKGRTLGYDDIETYRNITQAIRETLRIMDEIDAAIPSWPIE